MRSTAVPCEWPEDIVREILHHLSVVPERIQDFGNLPPQPQVHRSRQPDEVTLRRRTLASAARTCKAFSALASEALWAVLPLGHGLLPLIRTFSGIRKGSIAKPNFRARGWRDMEITDYYELEGPISHADWDRLQSLAARVRYLSYDNEHPRQVYNSVLELVLRRYEAHAAPLFPNLRAMEWRSSTGTQPQHRLLKSLLLTPLLSIFAFHGTNHGLMMDMALLAGLHPTLRHLWIHAVPQEGVPTASLSCFTHLVSLRVPHVSVAFFQRLGGLTSLQDLEISLAPDSLLEESAASVKPFNGFPALRRFATATTSTAVFPEELLYMLSSVSSSRLTVLDIGVDYSNDNGSGDPSDCLSEVGALLVLRNIQTLLLHADDMWHNAPISLFVLTGPFCTVETLTDVSFSARHNHITISEEDFHRVETAWPRLRVLRVRTRADTST
ncbi:hypothetical protein C8T65DRAFT_82940 [Cerioporus squamosus]|nr:hypothetical protein C8T65DRAFT_82940 [Cerioporus squamosus]